jgi:uncharacterized protein YecE (DUF72 family)
MIHFDDENMVRIISMRLHMRYGWTLHRAAPQRVKQFLKCIEELSKEEDSLDQQLYTVLKNVDAHRKNGEGNVKDHVAKLNTRNRKAKRINTKP